MLLKYIQKLSIQACIALFVIVFCSFIGFLFHSHILDSSYQVDKYVINTKNEANYQVFLNSNEFIDSPYLGMGQSYVSSMINYISISFSNNVNYQQLDFLNYNYTIYARLSASYKEDSGKTTEIWNKTYPLKIQENILSESSSFKIQEQLDIPYQYYETVVSNFRQNYQLNVDAKLDVIMDINYLYNTSESKNVKLKVTIPMNQDVFQIDTQCNANKSFSEKETISNMTMNSSLAVFVLGLLGIIDCLLFVIIVLKVLAIPTMSSYEKQKKKIKKEYGTVIVDVDNKIDFSKFIIFEIKTIEELIDLEEEIRIPILFYEKENLGVCYFVIIKDKYMYRYTLEDLERKKKNEKKKSKKN